MAPNIVYAVRHKNDAAKDCYNNKAVAVLEQIGRYGCFALLVALDYVFILLGVYFVIMLAIRIVALHSASKEKARAELMEKQAKQKLFDASGKNLFNFIIFTFFLFKR